MMDFAANFGFLNFEAPNTLPEGLAVYLIVSVTSKRWTSTILRLPLIPKIGLRLMRVNESYWCKRITEIREFLCPSAREHFMRRCTWLLRINSLWRTSQLSERSIAWSEKASQDTTRFTLSALWSPRKFTFSLKSKTSRTRPEPGTMRQLNDLPQHRGEQTVTTNHAFENGRSQKTRLGSLASAVQRGR